MEWLVGVSVPQPGIEPRPLAAKELHPNHWTARKVPNEHYFIRGEKKNDLKTEFSMITATNRESLNQVQK